MKLDIEWLDAPGVRDRVLAATWARFSFRVGDVVLTEVVDNRSKGRRTGVFGSVFPLAEWIVENWWELLYEPPPRFPLTGGRVAPPALQPWIRRHNFLAAREGNALPDLTIVRDGSDVLLHLEPDPLETDSRIVRFVGNGLYRVCATDFERSLQQFIDTVVARLNECFPDADDDVMRLREGWNAVQCSERYEAALCESLAMLGVDPYSPDEATESLLDTVTATLKDLPERLRLDLLEGSRPDSISDDFQWVEEAHSQVAHNGDTCWSYQLEGFRPKGSAHDTGYAAARLVRSDILRIPPDSPLTNLADVLADKFEWSDSGTKQVRGRTGLQGLVGLDADSARPVLMTATPPIHKVKDWSHTQKAKQSFRLARALYFATTENIGRTVRLLTNAATPPQRAARAFAAELLAPAAALRNKVSGRVTEEEMEQLATEFQVSSLVIRHQIENHDLGFVEI